MSTEHDELVDRVRGAVRKRLEAHGQTQEALASICGMRVTQINDILAGRRPLGLRTIRRLASGLGLAPWLLFARASSGSHVPSRLWKAPLPDRALFHKRVETAARVFSKSRPDWPADSALAAAAFLMGRAESLEMVDSWLSGDLDVLDAAKRRRALALEQTS
jgi:transcriptional regulator with XRE-family HTH domain